MADDLAFLDERIDRTKTMIIAYEDAITALAGGAQSYSLDTGQTRQSVTRAQLAELTSTLEQLENRLASLNARRNGGSIYVRPGF